MKWKWEGDYRFSVYRAKLYDLCFRIYYSKIWNRDLFRISVSTDTSLSTEYYSINFNISYELIELLPSITLALIDKDKSISIQWLIFQLSFEWYIK